MKHWYKLIQDASESLPKHSQALCGVQWPPTGLQQKKYHLRMIRTIKKKRVYIALFLILEIGIIDTSSYIWNMRSSDVEIELAIARAF